MWDEDEIAVNGPYPLAEPWRTIQANKMSKRLLGGWEVGSMGSLRYFPPGSIRFEDYTVKIIMRKDKVIAGIKSKSAQVFSSYFYDMMDPTDEEITLFELEYNIGPPSVSKLQESEGIVNKNKMAFWGD